MSQTRQINRLVRRETHSSRAALSIVTAALLLVAALWLVLELVLSVTGNTALLMSPKDLVMAVASLADNVLPAVLIGAGVAAVLLGIVLIGAAVLPGHKSRHVVANTRYAVVVDSEVLAAAISRTARTSARLAPEQVTSSVGRGRVQVMVRASVGRKIEAETIQEAVEREVSGYGLRRQLAVKISSSPHAEVNA